MPKIIHQNLAVVYDSSSTAKGSNTFSYFKFNNFLCHFYFTSLSIYDEVSHQMISLIVLLANKIYF